MAARYRAALFVHQPSDMQHAGHIQRSDFLRVAFHDMLDLQVPHRCRNIREGHRECAAKSAALLLFPKLCQLQPLYALQQGESRLDAVRPSAVAAPVQCDSLRISSWPLVYSQAIYDIVAQFPCALRDRCCGMAVCIRCLFCGHRIPVINH